MKAKLAVLGGGNTGCVMAAEFTLRGFDVTLYDEKKYWPEHIDGILANGGTVTVTGVDLTGDAHIARITDNLEEAVSDADIIFISMVVWRHDWIYHQLKPLLKKGQTVIFSAGNFSSIQMRGVIGLDAPVIVGEMMGNIFPCRMIDDHTAVIAGKLTDKLVAAFPGRDTEKLAETVGEVFHCTPAKNVFEAALNAPNVVIHLAASLMNITNAENVDHFRLYQQGLSPALMTCLKAIEAEKKQVMDRLGYKMVIHTDHMERVMQKDKYPELDLFRSLEGPSGAKHRYINEDAGAGDCLMLSLADRLGIDMPLLRSYVTIASAMNSCDYASEGITMDKLGIPGNDPETINAYLENAN